MDDIAASVYPEQSPKTRAERALNLLYVFKERSEPMASEEVEEAIADLLSDLMHLADTISPSAWRDTYLRGEHHYTAERHDCDYCDDLLPGAYYPVASDGDDSRAWVERCDNCGLFDSDKAAAIALAKKLGVSWLWARTASGVVRPALRGLGGKGWLPFGYGREGVKA